MMSPERKEKALFYARPVCLNDDGVGYRALWEVMTDRHDRRSSKNDQWIAPQRSVKLVALWVRVERYSDMTLGDELQLCWDDAIEIPPDFYAKRKAGKGNVQWNVPARPEDASMPPPGPKQKKPKVDQSPSSASAAASAGAGVSPASATLAGAGVSLVPASDTDDDEMSVDESKPGAGFTDYKSTQVQGTMNERLRYLLTTFDPGSATLEAHSPFTWLNVWNQVLKQEGGVERARVRFARKVIYQQTLMTLDNEHLHMRLTDLAAPRTPTIVNRSDLVCAPRRPGRRHYTKVIKADCLTAAEELTNVGYEHVAVLAMANQSRPGGQVVSGAGAQEEDVFRRTDVHRHVLRYKDSLGYPLDTTEPTAMVIRDVTICRGPCEQGYPFLDSTKSFPDFRGGKKGAITYQ